MPDHASAPILEPIIGVPLEERLAPRFQRRGKHPARALARDLGQGGVHRAGLAQGDNAGLCSNGVSLPVGGAGRLHHPPRSAAFSSRITQLREQLGAAALRARIEGELTSAGRRLTRKPRDKRKL